MMIRLRSINNTPTAHWIKQCIDWL